MQSKTFMTRAAKIRKCGEAPGTRPIAACLLLLLAGLIGACSPESYRLDADKVAADHIAAKQQEALGRREPFTIETPVDTLRRRLISGQELPTAGPASLGTDQLEPPKHWPKGKVTERLAPEIQHAPPWESDAPLRLSLTQSLQVSARNSREYQSRKEQVFRAALAFDLEQDAFDNTYTGLLNSLLSTDQSGGDSVTGVENDFDAGVTRRLKSGAVLAGRLVIDVAKLLSSTRESSLGLFADATVTIPLLRGSGKHIVTEPLTQAERDLIYAIWSFERFKRTFAVQVASEFLSVLRQFDQGDNATENYRRLVLSSRRARRLHEAGDLEKVQVDQALQDELRARDSWIAARSSHERALDRFKLTLGLPTDAAIDLDQKELDRLATAAQEVLGFAANEEPAPQQSPRVDTPIELDEPSRQGGRHEMDERKAIRLALMRRLDLAAALGAIVDAQRRIVVTADALKAGLALTGSVSAGERRGIGSADLDDAQLRPEHGSYSAGLAIDLPWERTEERNLYRQSIINLEQATRNLQELEDQIKLDVRDRLRELLRAREGYMIQARSVELAKQRVRSTELFLEAGEAQIRDLLEANEDLLSAQDARTAALVDYRVAELELQRDMGVLEVDHAGLWTEYQTHDAS